MTAHESVRRARDARWETPFGRWVEEIGVFRIVDALGGDPALAVTSHAVYEWIAGRRAPDPFRARALAEMSGGEITMDTIYDHTITMRQGRQTP